MTPTETAILIAKAQAAYPHREVTPETIQVFHERLRNIPAQYAITALNQHLDTHPHFPTISDILTGSVLAAEADARRNHEIDHSPINPATAKRARELISRINLRQVDA